MALGGGMAVQDVVAAEWEKVTGSPLLEAYGLSETSPAATINPVGGTHKVGTIGFFYRIPISRFLMTIRSK